MKKTKFTVLTGCLLIFFFINSVAAQTKTANINEAPVLTSEPAPSSKINDNEVNGRALRQFKKWFPGGQASWYTSGSNYLAITTFKGRSQYALFSPKGYMIYHISNGTEAHLPLEVRRSLRSKFLDFNIQSVKEVRAGDQTAWFVNLESSKELIVTRITDEEIETVSRYNLGH